MQFVNFDDLPEICDMDDISVKNNFDYNNFDDKTTKYYKALRIAKQDPISNLEVDINTCFKFEYMWDPHTGERLDKDPNGPLYFNPDNLAYYFYTNRLRNLWVEPKDEESGYFQGYYDMAVGSGENINIKGRGECPDKYLFRLPIIDCYVTKDHNFNHITLGPKLTDSEIQELNNLVIKQNTFYSTYKIKCPSLIQLKYWYDQALSLKPDLINKNINNMSDEQITELYTKANYNAVEELKKL